MKGLKKTVYAVWLLIILGLIILGISDPAFFTVENLVKLFREYQSGLIIIYCFVSFIRGFFLLPSTPFVLLGVVLFNDSPWMVFSISMLGIFIGSTALYYFSDLLGFSEKLNRKYPEKMEVWSRRMKSPKAVIIVLVWSFFPLVPTDLICYVAGIVKMPFKYLLAGVLIGEAILIYCYVFLGAEFMNFLG